MKDPGSTAPFPTIMLFVASIAVGTAERIRPTITPSKNNQALGWKLERISLVVMTCLVGAWLSSSSLAPAGLGTARRLDITLHFRLRSDAGTLTEKTDDNMDMLHFQATYLPLRLLVYTAQEYPHVHDIRALDRGS